ncbi:MAG: hypothetical protein ACKVVP_23670, partial [Chloroflexota bacterium]
MTGEPSGDGRNTGRPGRPGSMGSDLVAHEVVRGSKPGERYVRVVRPQHKSFRRVAPGHLETRDEAHEARTGVGKFWQRIRRVLIGRPLTSASQEQERLTKVKALAVLSSDALSSSAYATEEIIRVLVVAGVAAVSLTLPIAIAIAILLAIVSTSYMQTIKAYPQGGGSYIVTKDNLGTWPSLIAGSALMIDYILTVAVSISAGTAAVTSALPSVRPFAVEIGVFFILLITLGN